MIETLSFPLLIIQSRAKSYSLLQFALVLACDKPLLLPLLPSVLACDKPLLSSVLACDKPLLPSALAFLCSLFLLFFAFVRFLFLLFSVFFVFLSLLIGLRLALLTLSFFSVDDELGVHVLSEFCKYEQLRSRVM